MTQHEFVGLWVTGVNTSFVPKLLITVEFQGKILLSETLSKTVLCNKIIRKVFFFSALATRTFVRSFITVIMLCNVNAVRLH